MGSTACSGPWAPEASWRQTNSRPGNGKRSLGGQVTKYVYTTRAQLQEVEQSPNAWTDPTLTPTPLIKTVYSYDNLGSLIRVDRDGPGSSDTSSERVVDYAYDGLNRVGKATQYPQAPPQPTCWPATPNGTTTCPTLVTQYAYDLNRNRASLLDAFTPPQTTTFGYDAVNRLTSVTYSTPAPGTSATANVSYTYDLNGNRMSMVDSATTSYTYDEADRLKSVTSPGAQTIGYRYDLDGNRRKLIYPDGMAVNYTLDAADRLQSMTDTTTNGTTSYTYVPDSRLGGVSNFNSTSTTYTWDNARRVQQILHQDGGQTLSQHTFTLDALGNRTHFSEQLPQLTGLAPAMADTLLAQQPVDALATSSSDDLDQLVAATTDTPEVLAQAPDAQAAAPGAQVAPSRQLPLQDTASRAEQPALFHAEPTAHTLDVFDKSSPTASVRVEHAWTKASLRSNCQVQPSTVRRSATKPSPRSAT